MTLTNVSFTTKTILRNCFVEFQIPQNVLDCGIFPNIPQNNSTIQKFQQIDLWKCFVFVKKLNTKNTPYAFCGNSPANYGNTPAPGTIRQPGLRPCPGHTYVCFVGAWKTNSTKKQTKQPKNNFHKMEFHKTFLWKN